MAIWSQKCLSVNMTPPRAGPSSSQLYPSEKVWLPSVLEPVKLAYLTFPVPLLTLAYLQSHIFSTPETTARAHRTASGRSENRRR